MEVLLTGNTGFVTPAWMETAFPGDHVLTTSAQDTQHDPHVKAITLDKKQQLSQLVSAYEFDRIVYFSEYLIPHSEQEGELERLRRVLQANRERPVQLLYLAGPEGVVQPAIGKSVMAQAAEALCLHYAQNSPMQIKVLRLPYLYGADSAAGAVGFAPLFAQAEQGSIHFDEPAEAPVFALCAEDLAELIHRIFDTWTSGWERFTAPSVFSATTAQLGEKLAALRPGTTVTYGTDIVRHYPADDGVLRARYGWFPRYDLLADLPEMYGQWQEARHPQGKPLARLWEVLRSRKKLLALAEILAAWVVAELLVRMTNTQAQFRVVDFRLLFIVLCGTMYGLNAGVLAAAMASFSLVLGYLRQGTTPLLLFYDPANWLAFIVYFVAGAVCGYVQLRGVESVRFVKDENTQLRERLTFVRRLYQDTLEDKQTFRRQLLGRRDSFGKIYDVTRQLDVMQPQKLYHKTVQIMEDVLDNHSLAVYHLDDNDQYARLMACCAARESNTRRSIELADYMPVLRALEQDGLWVNRELLPDLPMYACGVRENGRLIVLIFLYEADGDQLTLYYQNLFRILCGLVETALTRAFEYENAAYREQHLPGTRVLRTPYFIEKLAASCAMQEDKVAQHLLLRVTNGTPDQQALYTRLDTAIRASDLAGIGPDGKLYLLMNQASEAELPIVTERLRGKGIQVEPISFEAQLDLAADRQGAQA